MTLTGTHNYSVILHVIIVILQLDYWYHDHLRVTKGNLIQLQIYYR